MNNKMAINTYLSRTEANKQTKQTRTERIMDTDSIFMVARWEGCGGLVRVLSTNKQLQNSHGDVQYGMGNGAAKELIHMTHGPEQSWGPCLKEWGMLGGGGQRG